MINLIKRYMKYDIRKIKKTNRRMKKACLNIKDVNIFWDLDNTLYMFCEKGKDKEAVAKSMEEGYYYNIPIFDGAAAFLKFLMGLCPNIYILSKYPRTGADIEKIMSIERDMPFFPKKNILLIGLDEDKGEVIKSICDPSKAIIIDDYCANIVDAYNQGVVGIKKTYSGKKRPCYQIKEFYDLLDVFKKLNISLEPKMEKIS